MKKVFSAIVIALFAFAGAGTQTKNDRTPVRYTVEYKFLELIRESAQKDADRFLRSTPEDSIIKEATDTIRSKESLHFTAYQTGPSEIYDELPTRDRVAKSKEGGIYRRDCGNLYSTSKQRSKSHSRSKPVYSGQSNTNNNYGKLFLFFRHNR